MGKPTGFIDYAREELDFRPPKDRLQDWAEIKTNSTTHAKQIRIQAARCMDCSIPFCHSGVMLNNTLSGCPLHNLMPEFNDFIYQGLDAFAYSRLIKTNNFPEFTSHVCPAPCEGACSASLVNDAVAIRNIEQYIIENAFAQKLVQPNIPGKRTNKKVAVIGSGPSGLACADELNKRGHHITIYEREDRPGGLLMYGIPNMKLSKAIVTRRIKLLEASGIQFKLNCEIGYNISSENLLQQYDAIVLCTGSTIPRDLPIKGRELKGIHFAKDYLQAATKTLLAGKPDEQADFTAKGKNVVVIGGGDTGTDCVATAIRQGCKTIRQLEIMPCLPHSRLPNNPWPEFPRVFKTDYGQEEALELFKADPRQYCVMSKEFLGNKDSLVTKLKICKVNWQTLDKKLVPVEIPGTEEFISADLVLLALGFTGTEPKIFDEFKIARTAQNNIAAGDTSFNTNIPKVFAAGDARRGQSLVVWAIAEGRKAAAAVNEYLTPKIK